MVEGPSCVGAGVKIQVDSGVEAVVGFKEGAGICMGVGLRLGLLLRTGLELG